METTDSVIQTERRKVLKDLLCRAIQSRQAPTLDDERNEWLAFIDSSKARRDEYERVKGWQQQQNYHHYHHHHHQQQQQRQHCDDDGQ
jgi:hypothetical protein